MVISSDQIRNDMIARGHEQVKKFEKKKIAEEMMETYRNI